MFQLQFQFQFLGQFGPLQVRAEGTRIESSESGGLSSGLPAMVVVSGCWAKESLELSLPVLQPSHAHTQTPAAL